MDIVNILQIGFAGPAYLLALFSYRLLAGEQKKEIPSTKNLDAITKFMYFSIFFGSLVFIAPYIPTIIEEKPNPLLTAMIEKSYDRTPMDPVFIAQQISILTSGHNERLNNLHQKRMGINELIDQTVSDEKRVYEKSLRRVEGYIRDENREFNSNVQKLRSML